MDSKRDDSRYGYAIRVPLNEEERRELRVLAAQKGSSQGALLADMFRALVKHFRQTGTDSPT
jgi:hypothetical protein